MYRGFTVESIRAGGSYFRVVRPKCIVEKTCYVGGSGGMPPRNFLNIAPGD